MHLIPLPEAHAIIRNCETIHVGLRKAVRLSLESIRTTNATLSAGRIGLSNPPAVNCILVKPITKSFIVFVFPFVFKCC